MRLTARDYEILRFLLDQKCATYWQLARRFWNKATKQTIYGRLKELQRERLIDLVGIEHYSYGVFILTRKGYGELKAKELHGKLGYYIYRESRTLRHELYLVDIRILFYELGFKNWVSKRMLRKNNIHSFGWVADGLIRYRNNSKILVEFDPWRKQKNIYVKIFSDYKSLDEIDAVFYLVGYESHKADLIQLAKGFPRVFFCIYDEFKEKKSEAVFGNINESFVLKEIM